MIEDEYDVFVDCKINRKPLPDRFEDHGLNNNRKFKDCRDAHLAGDTVVIYQEGEDEIKLLHVGNHSNLLENMKDNYSEYYKQIRTNAENNWPKWKKEAYNRDFATSKHARKFGTSNTDPDDRTTEFWECIYEDMKDIYNDGDNE